MPFTVIIPARYGSSRFPGKPLADIGGKPMVIRVAEQARKSGASAVIVATDHEGIAEAVSSRGYDAVMTRRDHESGTDRLAEVATLLRLRGRSVVVNVQGDEPFISPALIRRVAASLESHGAAAISTAAHRIQDAEELHNPNVVKVVADRQGYALYFSRAPIPWARDAFAEDLGKIPKGLPVLRHLGIYAYRASFLHAFTRLAPTPLERFEALEQLRALAHGYRISIAVTRSAPAPGIDTPADLERAQAALTGRRPRSSTRRKKL